MKINRNEYFVELVADEGKILTQANLENEDDRMFGGVMCLGKNDSEENYTEWLVEDADAFEAEREARRKAAEEEEEKPR